MPDGYWFAGHQILHGNLDDIKNKLIAK